MFGTKLAYLVRENCGAGVGATRENERPTMP
jgi:hypothetical protein